MDLQSPLLTFTHVSTHHLLLFLLLLLLCVCAQYGEEALKEGMGGGGGPGSMADLFDLFGGGGGRGRARERKSDDVHHKLQVSLEEMYNGVTK
jgi:hypothetical protein